MTLIRPIHATRARRVGAGLAILVLVLAACSAASQPASTSAAVAGQAAVTPAPTPAATSTPSRTPPATQAPTPSASPAPAAASQAAVNGAQTIHLILRPTNDTIGSATGCSSAGTCQGDVMVGYDPLFDAATSKEVGTFAYECFLVDVASVRYHCPGATITLTGRGQIVFAELIEHEVGRPPAVAPITGGTGEFLGATGTVTASVLSGAGDFVITFTR